MNKQEFILELRKRLSGLPTDDAEDRVTFYSEIIDDRIEEGLSQEEAVSSVGSVDEIVSQIISDIPVTKIAKERIIPKRKLNALEIILLALGSPIWLSLIIAALAVILAVYIVLWSVIISLWAIFVSIIATGLSLIIAGIGLAVVNNLIPGIAMIGAGFICTGLTIFVFLGCKIATKGIIVLTKKFAIWIKNCFVKKEEI